MKRLIALCLGAALALAPVSPAPASPAMSHVTAGCATSGTIATAGPVTIASGHGIQIGGNIRTASGSDVITATDDAGDIFTLHFNVVTGTGAFVGFAKTTGLTAQNVYLNTTGTWTVGCLSVEDVTNFNTSSPEDTGVLNTNGGTGTSPTVTSNTAAQSGDLLYSAFQSTNTSSYTESTSPAWTNTQNQAGNSSGRSDMGYIINAGTAGVARNGTFGSSATWHGIVMGIAPAATGTHSMGALGAGN